MCMCGYMCLYKRVHMTFLVTSDFLTTISFQFFFTIYRIWNLFYILFFAIFFGARKKVMKAGEGANGKCDERV